MWKRSKFLILFLMGILVGVGFYMGLHAARLYRPLPPPPEGEVTETAGVNGQIDN